jgi:hypothetical protein
MHNTPRHLQQTIHAGGLPHGFLSLASPALEAPLVAQPLRQPALRSSPAPLSLNQNTAAAQSRPLGGSGMPTQGHISIRQHNKALPRHHSLGKDSLIPPINICHAKTAHCGTCPFPNPGFKLLSRKCHTFKSSLRNAIIYLH